MAAELFRTPLEGVWELHSQNFQDHRGAFLNAFRLQEPVFQQVWGDRPIAQVNLSRTEVVGTVRGLHLQAVPHAEAKLVRALRGRVWDVAVDLRESSYTYGRWHAVELSPEQGNALLIPEGCAHGFQVMEASVNCCICTQVPGFLMLSTGFAGMMQHWQLIGQSLWLPSASEISCCLFWS